VTSRQTVKPKRVSDSFWWINYCNSVSAPILAGTFDVSVVGLGYVGLPLALQFAEAKAKVIGLDIDPEKVRKLGKGESYLMHVEGARIYRLIQAGHLTVSTDFSLVVQAEAVVICVPTPLNKNREPDISHILKTGEAIAPYLRADAREQKTEGGGRKKLIVLESTTYPGTTDTDLREVLEKGSSLKAGKDFHLAFSPEREDPGNPQSRVADVPKVVGGFTPACLARAMELYGRAVKTLVPVSSTRVAEATKLMENIFRSVNIALVNEMKLIYGAMGIDIWEVIEAAKTKPFGFMPFYPGPGLGGHCIPIDPFYLSWKAREYGRPTRFIELAGEINSSMPEHVVTKVTEALNQAGKAVRGSTILLLGLAYKADVDDDRESPSYVLMEKLEAHGARVIYHDPHIPVIRPTREHAPLAGRRSVPIDASADLVLLATAHRDFRDHDFSRLQVPFIDTRNCVPATHRPSLYVRA
jgi:UDP-N-acetyl-D-glucosamine dehydrogenase